MLRDKAISHAWNGMEQRHGTEVGKGGRQYLLQG